MGFFPPHSLGVCCLLWTQAALVSAAPSREPDTVLFVSYGAWVVASATLVAIILVLLLCAKKSRPQRAVATNQNYAGNILDVGSEIDLGRKSEGHLLVL